MAYANLTSAAKIFSDGFDSIVWKDVFAEIRGGRTLDVTGFTPTKIQAGHVIIKETATGEYKPMPVNGGATAYATLPSGHTYAGALRATVESALPMASIVVNGTINPVAAPYDFATIAAAFKTAMPLIDQRAD